MKFKPKPPQIFEDLGATVRVRVESKKYGAVWFVVDTCDWNNFDLRRFRFSIVNGYVVYRDPQTRKIRKVHSLLLPSRPGYEVDHVDRDKLNNTRKNLRYLSRLANVLNRGRLVTNTSGVTGVSWDRRSKKWQAYFSLDGKMRHRYFENLEGAVACRKAWEREFFAPLFVGAS